MSTKRSNSRSIGVDRRVGFKEGGPCKEIEDENVTHYREKQSKIRKDRIIQAFDGHLLTTETVCI